jgi:hypothetical protein
MNDTAKTETFATFPALAWEFASAGSHTTEQVCNQAQMVAKAIADWNAECHRFVSHRMSRTSDAIVKIVKSQSLPEVLAIQAKWLEDAVEDYIKETNVLMGVNTKLMTGLVPRVGQDFQSSVKA